MWEKIEMEVPFMKYTANYLCLAAKIVCSVHHKWHFHFCLIPHSDFGFFFLCRLITPERLYKKCKKPVFEFGGKQFVPSSGQISVKILEPVN